jgi:hypothetical protein
MKIRIVSYEDLDAWICGKIAKRLTDALVALGHECAVGKTPDLSAEINHHVIYLNYPGHTTGVHTLMITHIDDISKLHKLKAGLNTAHGGICASSDTLTQLTSMGLEADKLTYVNLAHDGKAIPRRFVIGITTRLYPDGRKREGDVSRLVETISPNDFSFKIMGFGWRPIVEKMRKLGFLVEYQEDFHYDNYMVLLASLDYFLYLGKDEGSMGFIDALAAGVKTIVSPQGHHLDAKNGITHSVENFEELRQTFEEIAAQRRELTSAVADWTWKNYAVQHVAVWERCLAGQAVGQAGDTPAGMVSRSRSYLKLFANAFIRKGIMITNLNKEYECGSRWWSRPSKNKSRQEAKDSGAG